MTTTFGDLCDFLCEPFKHAPSVREKRQGLAGSAELPIGIKIQLWAAKKEQDALLEEMDITLLKVQNCAAQLLTPPLELPPVPPAAPMLALQACS